MNPDSSRPDDPLDADVAGSLAASLRPVSADNQRDTALRARVLAAAAATRQPLDGQFRFVSKAERVWEKRRLGVEFCLLHEDDHSRAFLMRLQPGGVLPAHTHDLDEESLMLEGDAWIGQVRYLTAGDYHYVPAGTPHPDLVSPNGCTVFVRGEKRYRPRITVSLIGRLLRGMFGRP